MHRGSSIGLNEPKILYSYTEHGWQNLGEWTIKLNLPGLSESSDSYGVWVWQNSITYCPNCAFSVETFGRPCPYTTYCYHLAVIHYLTSCCGDGFSCFVRIPISHQSCPDCASVHISLIYSRAWFVRQVHRIQQYRDNIYCCLFHSLYSSRVYRVYHKLIVGTGL